jgi:hypothetical protein
VSPPALHDEIAASPALYPLDRGSQGAVRLLRLTEADYVQASFLDERMVAPGRKQLHLQWTELEAAARRLPLGADFIFHIGHVGSTLLARLLGRSAGIFALREPALLRTLQPLSSGEADDDLLSLLRLYARVWRDGQRSLVKATSFASDLAPAILRADTSARAVLMAVRAQTFIAAILGGEATRAELPRVTPPRLARLANRLGGAAPAVSGEGETAAAGWLAEMCALGACARTQPARCLWLDFDAFLLDPRAGLSSVLAHLTGSVDRGELSAMLASPDMTRYSKATEYPFSAGQRGRLLREAGVAHAAQIARGMAWLGQVRSRLPLDVPAGLDLT